MENLTLVGMKDLNQRLARIERSLERIAKSLETLVKIQNKQIPTKLLITEDGTITPVTGLAKDDVDDEEEE